MEKKIIVLAGSREQFERYLDENGLTDSQAVYGWCAERILGIQASKVEKIGTWYEVKDHHELERLAESRIF